MSSMHDVSAYMLFTERKMAKFTFVLCVMALFYIKFLCTFHMLFINVVFRYM